VQANASYIYEKRKLHASFDQGAAESRSTHLGTLHADVGYIWRQTVSASVGIFDITGKKDALLYPEGEVDGSANGSPNSRGYTLQLEYVPFGKIDSIGRPWLNARLGLQYTGYDKFNGGKSNYDGAGRSASANNTTMAFLWLAF
jgi:hypothetical protein